MFKCYNKQQALIFGNHRTKREREKKDWLRPALIANFQIEKVLSTEQSYCYWDFFMVDIFGVQ